MLDPSYIQNALGLKSPVTSEQIHLLVENAKMKSFNPKELIIKEGDLNNNLYFILKGIIRIYHVNDLGKEFTIGIYTENSITGALNTMMQNKPSRYNFEAYEVTDVLYMPYPQVERIISTNESLKDHRLNLYENVVEQLIDQVNSFIIKTSEERYLEFIETHTNIMNRIPNKFISNLLGITPVQLSRIRKRLASR